MTNSQAERMIAEILRDLSEHLPEASAEELLMLSAAIGGLPKMPLLCGTWKSFKCCRDYYTEHQYLSDEQQAEIRNIFKVLMYPKYPKYKPLYGEKYRGSPYPQIWVED